MIFFLTNIFDRIEFCTFYLIILNWLLHKILKKIKYLYVRPEINKYLDDTWKGKPNKKFICVRKLFLKLANSLEQLAVSGTNTKKDSLAKQ